MEEYISFLNDSSFEIFKILLERTNDLMRPCWGGGGGYVPCLNFEVPCVTISEVLCVDVRISLTTLLLVLSL